MNEETQSLEGDINLNYNDNIFSEVENNVVTDVIDFTEEDEVNIYIYFNLKKLKKIILQNNFNK